MEASDALKKIKMKKSTFRRLAVIVAVALGSLFATQRVSAATHEKTLGLSGGYASHNNSGFIGLYFHYNFFPHFRIAPEAGIVFRHEGDTGLILNADLQFPFRVARAFSIYPLAGVAFNNWSHHGEYSTSRVGVNAGAGFDLYLTSNLKFSVQGKYSFMKDTEGAYAGIGLGYIF